LKGVAPGKSVALYVFATCVCVCVCVLHAVPDWGSPASIDSPQSPILSNENPPNPEAYDENIIKLKNVEQKSPHTQPMPNIF
jgi:hypothetical protein